MTIEIKIPELGESIQEAVLVQWYGQEGERVQKGSILFVIETDKVTLEVTAETDGILHILVPEGETVQIGSVVGTIETLETQQIPEQHHLEPATGLEQAEFLPRERIDGAVPLLDQRQSLTPPAKTEKEQVSTEDLAALSPAVRRMLTDKKIDISQVKGTGRRGRITTDDILQHLQDEPLKARPQPLPAEFQDEQETTLAETSPTVSKKDSPGELEEMQATTRKPMSRMRMRIAERLLQAKQNTAMLTTFNEIDMSGVQAIRKRFKEAFKQKYGVSLGLMSFFVKATVTALKDYPEVNARIDGKDIVYHHYVHMGIAIGAEKGLVVPVIRYADRLSFAAIERSIIDYVDKVRKNRLQLSDLEGGTFTISNGGVYGSLLSTPILNTPQSGILGLHKIENRPVAIDDRIVIRPMMYVALSYDHRIVDGREAVGFLKRIKECIENPERILIEL